MGSSKNYDPSGGFKIHGFVGVGTTANGIKIIEPKNINVNNNTQTPFYSSTAGTMYAKASSGKINQISVYGAGVDKRQKLKDIDFGHYHTNPDKKKHFGKKDIHIHVYNGKNRSSYARKPSKKERRLIMIAIYGKRK